MAAFQKSTAPPSTPAQEFYTWTFPGAPVRIHLHLNLVESLGREVRRAFESVPSHSVEIGGILYGSADFAASRVVEIKDFEPFLSEYRADHRFILSDGDRRKLDRLLAARRADGPEALAVVGYYRSHIGDGLSLREEDVAVAQGHFFDPANVFLLVKPSADGSASAGFFFWDNGRIDPDFTYLEFPFDARQLTGPHVRPTPRSSTQELARLSEPEAHAEPAALPPTPEPPAEYEAERPRGARSFSAWHAALFALVMIVLGALGYQGYLAWGPQQSGTSVPNATDSPALALEVERRGADLRVSWNRTSPAIVHAAAGSLSIIDGESQQQELHLDAEQLHSGSVTYTPANATVKFRLEVTRPGGSKTSESVLALTAARSASPASSQPASGPSPQPDAAATTSSGASKDSGEPLRVRMVDSPAQQATSDVPAAPQGKPESAGSAAALYLPPRPVRQVQPVLPSAVRRLIAAEIEVPIKVSISNTGLVMKAEALPTGQLVSSSLVTAAQQAALRWRFAPALRGAETVPSEMILKFQYRPVER